MPEIVRVPSRAELFRVLKDDALVLAFEQILNAVNNTLPGAADLVQENLDAHIADTGDAHQASAIGATPGGSRPANTVQGQLANLDSAKADATATTAALAGKSNVGHTHVTGDISGLGSMATQNASGVAITGGAINATPIGATTAASGRFTAVESLSFVRHAAVTVGALPAAASSQWCSYYVTDATATTYNAIVAGGGTNKVRVFSDGANWLIG